MSAATNAALYERQKTTSAHKLWLRDDLHQGSMRRIQMPLFMSADSGGPMVPPPCVEDWSEGTSRDCVVCQNAAVNRVLLPCRHACVCDQCVSYFQHCPICRAFVMESFILGLTAEQGHQQEG